MWQFEDFELDAEEFKLRKAGKPVSIQAKPLALLAYLVRNHGRLVTREEIYQNVWPGVVVSEASISTALSDLRRALGDDVRAPRFIQTIRAHGIRFVADVVDMQGSSRIGRNLARGVDAEISSGSIAVLRFVDMSPEQDQGALCAGIAEEILNKLARIRDLKVIARTSSFQFDPSTANVREVGQRLGVRHVLEGSVRTAGNQVRITAQLIECEGESHRWSESYTHQLVDLFMLYDEVAAAIAQALELVISADRTRPTAPPTSSEEALKLVVAARYQFEETGNPHPSFPLVERALLLDPDYANAHFEKGDLYFRLAFAGYETPEPNYVVARTCLEKALSLDASLADAHERLGDVRAHLELDWELAAASWRQAERLRGYSKKYVQLPVAGHYEQAEQDCLRNIERDPLNADPRRWLGRTLARLGRVDEATQHMEAALALAPRNWILLAECISHLLDFAGDVKRAEQIIAESRYSRRALAWARARIAHARGDARPLRSLVDTWIAHREKRYIRAWNIEDECYKLADYEAHIRWFAVREEEKDNLYWLPMMLRDRPDYWDRLSDWVIEKPSEVRSRMALLNGHRARIDRITERMVLPRDYID